MRFFPFVEFGDRVIGGGGERLLCANGRDPSLHCRLIVRLQLVKFLPKGPCQFPPWGPLLVVDYRRTMKKIDIESEQPTPQPSSRRTIVRRAARRKTPAYSSNRSLVPADFFGAIEASGACAGSPGSRKRLTIG